MVSKILGYALAGIGLVAVAITSFPQAKEIIKIPEIIPDTALLIGGIILVAIGTFSLMKSGGKKSQSEVPIYRGKNVVGYRRH